MEMPLATARAMLPALEVIDADPVADGKTLETIADWCDRFTPLVALDGGNGLFLDITGCAHLFGGEAAMMGQVCNTLSRQGFIVSGAIAGTAMAARALTRHAHGRIVACGDEAAAVAPLLVATLGADEKIVRGLHRAGLKTIGDVASRSPAEITARFGAAFTSILQQALGQGDAPISPRKPAPDYVAEKRFAEPVATQEVIALTLSSLAAVLTAAMERHGKGARLLEASFFRTDGTVRALAVEAGQPVTQPKVIERLFAEKLDALADPLDPGFRLRPDPPVGGSHRQRAGGTARLRYGCERSRRCEPACRSPGRAAWPAARRSLPAAGYAHPGACGAGRACAGNRRRWSHGLSLCRTSRPRGRCGCSSGRRSIEVTADFPDGAPAQFRWRRNLHVIVRAEGPERIAMEWWRHRDEDDDRDGRRVRQAASAASRHGCRSNGTAACSRAIIFARRTGQGVRYWIYREGVFAREVRNLSLVPARAVRMTYVEIGVTTNFSFLRGASHPQEYVHQAAAYRLAGDRRRRPQHAGRRGARLFRTGQ